MTDDRMQIHSQRESKLLSAPVEIRRAIYVNIHCQLHAFLSQGRIHLSSCLQPNLGDNRHDGYERQPKPEGSSPAQWARRLRSTWGPHWECEEVAFAENTDLHEHSRNDIYSLLFVCKKMFLDMCDFVAETTVINITDLDTLEVLLPKPCVPGSSPNRPWNLWNYVHPRIHKLNITLRLPLAFYKALEEDALEEEPLEEDRTFAPAANYHPSTISTPCATWLCLWSAICQLQQLRRLYVWLDHDGVPSWSIVKERLVLHRAIGALAAHMQSRSREEILSQIDIRFNLPKLHPRIARPETHFIQESISLPFTIERRFRQRYHSDEGADGTSRVKYEADFPIMHVLLDFREDAAESSNDPGQPIRPALNLQEIEIVEKRMWEAGINVDREMQDFQGSYSGII